MTTKGHRWAIVLAAGDGARLSTISTDAAGRPVPKQFCSLDGGPTLLQEAFARASRVVASDRIAAVVARRHRRFWQGQVPPELVGGVIEQPENRGTAAGIALPILELLRLDSEARVVLVPSDHHVRDERALASTIARAFAHVEEEPGALVMIGITPDAPEPEYGWIVPHEGDDGGPRRVARFVEKPPEEIAARLQARGGAWNSFIQVGRATTIVELIRRRLPDLIARLDQALDEREDALERCYETLPSADFSRDVVEGAEDRLRVLRAPACGWTDLGTPRRVAECVASRTGSGRSRGAWPTLADRVAAAGLLAGAGPIRVAAAR